MSQSIPSETIEYERYVDGLRKSSAAMLEALHHAREHISGEVDVVDGHYGVPAPNAAMQLAQEIDYAIALAERTGISLPSKIITVSIDGGLVQDVTGIPTGFEVHVHDYDEGGTSHPSWDEEKGCFVQIYGADHITTQPESEELVQFDEAQARHAFDRAIAAGILSKDEDAENAAAAYMFMGTLTEGDAFKHIGTRQYIYHKQGDAS